MPKKYVFDVIADGTSEITIEQDITKIPSIVPGLMAMDLWSNAERRPISTGLAIRPKAKAFCMSRPMAARSSAFSTLSPKQSAWLQMFRKHIARLEARISRVQNTSRRRSIVDAQDGHAELLCAFDGRLWPCRKARMSLMEPWRNDGNEIARLFAVLIDANWDKKAS